MTTHDHRSILFTTQPNRMWSGAIGPDTQTRLFRRSFNVVGEIQHATLQLYAQAKYALYVDGDFVDRGPCFHHPMVAPFDTHDLTDQLITGSNVIAVLVQAINVGVHNHVPSGEPGLCVKLQWTDEEGTHTIEADNQWRVTDKTGWTWPNPQRTWAIGPVEIFDMAQSSPGWQQLDFDDSTWQKPEISPLGQTVPSGVTPMNRPTPMLQYHWQGLGISNLMNFHATSDPVKPVKADDPKEVMAQRLEELTLIEPSNSMQCLGKDKGDNPTLTVTGLTPDCGAVVHLDLSAMYIGQVLLDADLPSEGVIDIAWTEALVDGKPCWTRKGASYVDRIYATAGKLNWRPITFSGMQYVSLILRGFTGDVKINRVGVHASEPNLTWPNDFATSNPMLNDIHKVCERTIRIGTQEALMDCPTREQAAYVGDGLPVAKWIYQLTGDARYFRDLVIEQFRRQSEQGLIRSTPYSWRDDTLVDYNLIAILGTLDYLQLTGDKQTVKDILPAARKLISWFTNQLDQNDGLLSWQWTRDRKQGEFENQFDPSRPKITGMNLFIDHAGMGWHCVDDAGIERRGTNAALHAFLCLALDAMAKIESTVGDKTLAQTCKIQSTKLTERCKELFFDTQQNYFIDGVLDGIPFTQVSEQTNTLAILAGWCDTETAGDILRRILTTHDKAIARNGYYFWLYTFEALKNLDMIPLAMQMIQKHWQAIVKANSSTVWETMAGDDLDSFCHPWSCVPASTLLTDILGFSGLTDETSTLAPRYDMLKQAQGSIHTQYGKASLSWQTDDQHITLAGTLPPNITANILSPDCQIIGKVNDTWELKIPTSTMASV
ncbi:MAG TPA: hypothetical protein DCM28_09465 [Phycisphaerales bacterium]|nr:hypothetical protein [Phycisphaerales bacterium]